MRTQAMSSRMLYNRPLPISRIVGAIADSTCMDSSRRSDTVAQSACISCAHRGPGQHAALRPTTVRCRSPRRRLRCTSLVSLAVCRHRQLVLTREHTHQDKGPHLYEFSPSGNCLEYYAMSIGARSQSAKTYLEAHFEEFADCDLDTLIKHGLHALRETLQQDKELTIHNTSIGIVGVAPPSSSSTSASESAPKAAAEAPAQVVLGTEPLAGKLAPGHRFEKFRILEGEELQPALDAMDPKDDSDTVRGRTGEATAVAGETPAAGDAAPTPGDSMQTD